jgi:hypothetical protein
MFTYGNVDEIKIATKRLIDHENEDKINIEKAERRKVKNNKK